MPCPNRNALHGKEILGSAANLENILAAQLLVILGKLLIVSLLSFAKTGLCLGTGRNLKFYLSWQAWEHSSC